MSCCSDESSNVATQALLGSIAAEIKTAIPGAELRLYLNPVSRAEHARIYIHSRFISKQQFFLDKELGQNKLTPFLRIRCQNAIADLVADLCKPMCLFHLLWLADTAAIFWQEGDRSR